MISFEEKTPRSSSKTVVPGNKYLGLLENNKDCCFIKTTKKRLIPNHTNAIKTKYVSIMILLLLFTFIMYTHWSL